jgi:hypothetical protein
MFVSFQYPPLHHFKRTSYTHQYLLQMELKLPEYISISDYRKIVSLEHLTESEQMLERIAILTRTDREIVRSWTGDNINTITDQITALVQGTQPEFYPLIEYNDEVYGFSSLSKMTLGEYVDLESLCKNPNENLSEIMALLYRKVTDNKFDSFKWKLKSRVKLAIDKTENLFKYYKIEPYNSDNRPRNAEVFDSFPVQYVLGALFFFTLIRTSYTNDMNLSLTPEETIVKTMMKKQMDQLSLSIGVGLAQFMVSQKPMYFQLPEIEA